MSLFLVAVGRPLTSEVRGIRSVGWVLRVDLDAYLSSGFLVAPVAFRLSLASARDSPESSRVGGLLF